MFGILVCVLWFGVAAVEMARGEDPRDSMQLGVLFFLLARATE